MRGYNKDLQRYSRELRKNMTEEEIAIWVKFLKKLPITVNRQKIIGNYIVDFFIASKSIAIEIDGAQHKMPSHDESDKKRDDDLYRLGIRNLRYTNEDINKRFEFFCEDILKKIGLTVKDMKK